MERPEGMLKKYYGKLLHLSEKVLILGLKFCIFIVIKN